MSNPLEKYFSERYNPSGDLQKDPGPDVTISREFGCPAKIISDMLASKLNEMPKQAGRKEQWQVVSKEILDDSARELKTEGSKIEYVFNYEQPSLIDEFLESLSAKYYHSDWKIRDTIKKVIRSLGVNGHTIIIGQFGRKRSYNNYRKGCCPDKPRYRKIATYQACRQFRLAGYPLCKCS